MQDELNSHCVPQSFICTKHLPKTVNIQIWVHLFGFIVTLLVGFCLNCPPPWSHLPPRLLGNHQTCLDTVRQCAPDFPLGVWACSEICFPEPSAYYDTGICEEATPVVTRRDCADDSWNRDVSPYTKSPRVSWTEICGVRFYLYCPLFDTFLYGSYFGSWSRKVLFFFVVFLWWLTDKSIWNNVLIRYFQVKYFVDVPVLDFVQLLVNWQ